MTKAQEILKADIEKLEDENILEKINIFIMGILAQQSIDKQLHKQQNCVGTEGFFEQEKNKDIIRN